MIYMVYQSSSLNWILSVYEHQSLWGTLRSEQVVFDEVHDELVVGEVVESDQLGVVSLEIYQMLPPR